MTIKASIDVKKKKKAGSLIKIIEIILVAKKNLLAVIPDIPPMHIFRAQRGKDTVAHSLCNSAPTLLKLLLLSWHVSGDTKDVLFI